jgi:hypothetical protein
MFVRVRRKLRKNFRKNIRKHSINLVEIGGRFCSPLHSRRGNISFLPPTTIKKRNLSEVVECVEAYF